MAERAPELMTVDEFLRWSDDTDTRHELADGVLRAMAPPAGAHGIMVANATALIHRALQSRRPCRPQNEAGIRIAARTMWQADIAVSCEPPAAEVLEPLLIVEVLSPSTRMNDLGRKLNDYKSLSSVQEIWMVDSERRWVQVWQREGERWVGWDFVGGGSFASGVLAQEVEMSELYEESVV